MSRGRFFCFVVLKECGCAQTSKLIGIDNLFLNIPLLLKIQISTDRMSENTEEVYEKGCKDILFSCSYPLYNALVIIVGFISLGCIGIVGYSCKSAVEKAIIVITIYHTIKVFLSIYTMLNAELAGTISHTVAQRYNPVAYFAIESLSAFSHYALALIVAGFIGSSMQTYDYVMMILEILSVSFVSMIFIFPASFSFDDEAKTEQELGYEPRNWYVSKTISRDYSTRVKVYIYLMVLNIPASWSNALHGFFAVFSAILAVISMILYLYYYGIKHWFEIAVLVCLVLGSFFIAVFPCARYFFRTNQQLSLFAEILGYYFLLYGLILLSFGAGNVISSFPPN